MQEADANEWQHTLDRDKMRRRKRPRSPTAASYTHRQQREPRWAHTFAIRAAKALLVVLIAVILSNVLPPAITDTNIFCSSSFRFLCPSQHRHIRAWFLNAHSTGYDGRFAAAYYPSLMNIQSEALRLLLDATHDNSGVAMELVNLRAATSDLCTVASASDLEDREVVYNTLRGVAADVQALGRRLTKSRARINGFADISVLAVSDFSARSIQASTSNRSPDSDSSPSTKPQASAKIIARTFRDFLDTLLLRTRELLLETKETSLVLGRLERRLSLIQALTYQSSASLRSVTKDDILAALWEELTHERADSPNVKRHLATLASASSSFRLALESSAKVYGVLHGLERSVAMMRDRSTTKSDFMDGMEEFSTRVLVQSIDGAAERIRAAQDAADAREKDLLAKWHADDLF